MTNGRNVASVAAEAEAVADADIDTDTEPVGVADGVSSTEEDLEIIGD